LLRENYRLRGKPIPEHLQQPLLDEYLEQFISAFWILGSARQIHMAGAGPIPWQVMNSYAYQNGYGSDSILYEDFMHLIREMDEEFLKDQAERRSRELKNGKPKGVRPPHGGPGKGRYL
jgi:hypothetical protein